ncbi:MAG TPA: hypothetical protein DD723_01210 [Candidatus Omnitrophica bacterium]|nr:MAG: hypothetical protein A2Z81_02215 [Omnitrophica WOR_2 bacterium GWA2_45_18]HBR14149.1 hypothetical protein [Candidatus Omnitrophota bacterium]
MAYNRTYTVNETIAGATKQKRNKGQDRKASAIKKSVTGIGQSFSRSAERVANIILDDHHKVKGPKTKKITEETISMFKEVTKQFKTNLKDVHPWDFIDDAAYGAGRISGMTKRVLCALFNCVE